MSHPSFWQNEQTLLLAAAPPDFQGEMAEFGSSFVAAKLSHFSLFSGGGAALQAAEKFDTVGEPFCRGGLIFLAIASILVSIGCASSCD